MSLLGPFRASLGFLTAFPVGRRSGEPDWRWAAAWFPVAGLIVGALLYAAMLLPVPALPRAVTVLVLWVAITGGLHEDGWIDCVDAAFAHVPAARRLEILRDPHVGAHGLTGGVLLQLLRFGALAVVPPVALLAAPVVGRWAMALSLALARPARPAGLGALLSAAPRPLAATLVAALVLAPLALAAPTARVLGAWLVGGLAGASVGRFLSGRFGGLTGDGHGAVGVAAELGALWAFLPLQTG